MLSPGPDFVLRSDRRGIALTASSALRYWNMARQRHCRRLARNGKPGASLADPVVKPAAQTRAESRVLNVRKQKRERDRLSAGGRWIRTLGPRSGATPLSDR